MGKLDLSITNIKFMGLNELIEDDNSFLDFFFETLLVLLCFAFPRAEQTFLFSLCSLSLATQSGLTLCDPTDCSPPGSSVHGIPPGKNTGVGCNLPPGDITYDLEQFGKIYLCEQK